MYTVRLKYPGQNCKQFLSNDSLFYYEIFDRAFCLEREKNEF